MGSHPGTYFDSSSHRGDADTVTIPSSHLLFSGDYQRSGADLVVSDHDHRVVVPNYFHGEKRPTLVSPEGAPLDPKVIEALTGHVAYAQAAGTAPAAKVEPAAPASFATASPSMLITAITSIKTTSCRPVAVPRSVWS